MTTETTQFKGTPGPYVAVEDVDGNLVIRTGHWPEGKRLFVAEDYDDLPFPEEDADAAELWADARLFAASWDLLTEAANIANRLGGWREVVAEIDDLPKNEALAKAMYAVLDQMDDARKTLRAAIAKALGS